MRTTLLALALATATVSPALALAQGPETAPRTEVFDDADLVTGTLQSPDADIIRAHGRMHRRTLIQPRAHYNPEMLRSVENL
ncbi:MAG: hypothetical protein U0234_07715 [Sandaracinus sp.]